MNLCGGDNNYDVGKKITAAKKKFAPSSFRAKFVDDMTIAEAFNMKDSVIQNTDRNLPNPFHARLGLNLAPEKSLVYSKIEEIKEYSEINQMRLNL